MGAGTGSSDVLDLSGNVTANYSLNIGAGTNGTVNFNGITVAASANGIGLTSGAINVTNNSTLTGPFTNAVTGPAVLTVNAGKTLTATAATFTNNTSGTVHVSAGATANWGNFINYGVYSSDPSVQSFINLTVLSGGYITAGTGNVYSVQGDFTNNSTKNALWSTDAAELDFSGASTHHFALAGADDGAVLAGFTNNFSWATLNLVGQAPLVLSDGNTSIPGGALYVDQIEGLAISGNQVTNITSVNGLNIYYDAPDNPGLFGRTFNLEGGGELIPVGAVVPEPATIIVWSLLGAGSWLGLRISRRRRVAVWSPEARAAIREIVGRCGPR